MEKIEVKLRSAYAAKINEAKALQENAVSEGGLTAEISQQIDGLLGEADVIMAQIEQAKKISAGTANIEEPAEAPKAASFGGFRPAGEDEGNAPVDPKAWREMEVKSELGTVVVRYNVPIAVQGKGYPSAFEAYLRKDFSQLGPNDRKTLSEGIDSAGGYLVPEDGQARVIKKIATLATVRANALVIQTARDIVRWPKVHYTSNDQYTSGVRMTWTGEAPSSSTVHRVTDPVFGETKIPVYTAMASMPLYNDLVEDSAFDVLGLGSDLIGEAFALGENDAFWNGSGVTRPMGILTGIGGDGPSYVASGTASTLTADGLINLVYALPDQYDFNAKLYWNKATEKAVRKLKDSSNRYLWPENGNLAGAPKELLGYPYVRDSMLPDIGANAYPIVFGDLRAYCIVDRVGLSIQRLSEIYAESNIVLLLARKRVGGSLIEPWRIKVQKVAAS